MQQLHIIQNYSKREFIKEYYQDNAWFSHDCHGWVIDGFVPFELEKNERIQDKAQQLAKAAVGLNHIRPRIKPLFSPNTQTRQIFIDKLADNIIWPTRYEKPKDLKFFTLALNETEDLQPYETLNLAKKITPKNAENLSLTEIDLSQACINHLISLGIDLQDFLGTEDKTEDTTHLSQFQIKFLLIKNQLKSFLKSAQKYN